MFDYLRAKELIECEAMKKYKDLNSTTLHSDLMDLIFIVKKDTRMRTITKHLQSSMQNWGFRFLPKPVLILLFEMFQVYARSHWNNLQADCGLANWRYRFFSERIDFPKNFRDL